uniref:Uncharacterized protein n=1 Tax=Rhizophora mucronata TaxID=61149 RepID=A0A2P2PV27_RHIMU
MKLIFDESYCLSMVIRVGKISRKI